MTHKYGLHKIKEDIKPQDLQSKGMALQYNVILTVKVATEPFFLFGFNFQSKQLIKPKNRHNAKQTVTGYLHAC